MRGKGKYHGKHHAAGGITPAYAGKSFPARIAHPDFRDHPRLCGEKTVSTCPRLADTGSPPPMRGKELDKLEFGVDAGITPAYAGKRQHDNPATTML